jgi:hypothetical protein
VHDPDDFNKLLRHLSFADKAACRLRGQLQITMPQFVKFCELVDNLQWLQHKLETEAEVTLGPRQAAVPTHESNGQPY